MKIYATSRRFRKKIFSQNHSLNFTQHIPAKKLGVSILEKFWRIFKVTRANVSGGRQRALHALDRAPPHGRPKNKCQTHLRFIYSIG